MSYQVHFESKLLGLAGSSYFTSAPHSITPHSTIANILSQNNLYLAGTLFGSTPVPGYFRGYVMQNPAVADDLLNRAAQTTALWRVYIKGEPITGLPVTLPSNYYSTPGGRYETTKEFTYLYDRRVPLSAVETVRIELGE